MRKWLAETHGSTFELVRFFLASFFETEIVVTPDAWVKSAIGIFAALVSIGIVAFPTYVKRYGFLNSPDFSSRAIYGAAIRSDALIFIGIAMVVTAVVTLLQWQSVFPSLKDSLALAGQPVTPQQVFTAKFLAVLFAFWIYVMALNQPWAGLFNAASAGPFRENPSRAAYYNANFSSTAGACVFVFFTLMSLQGILLNILPPKLLDRVSLVVQSLLFLATMALAPLVARQPHADWWPGMWFLRLWESLVMNRRDLARPAWLAMLIPALLTVLVYLLSFHRYRKVLLESQPPVERVWSGRFGSRLLERLVPEPTEQAAFAFIAKSLSRSRSHRFILLAYSGLALSWVVLSALDGSAAGSRNDVYNGLAAVAPVALAALLTLALRQLFSVPVSLRANWVFQTVEHGHQTAWLRAVERFVGCGIAPVFLLSFPAGAAILGWSRAATIAVSGMITAMLWFEVLFMKWQKMPFTCSFLPPQTPFAISLVKYALAVPVLASVGELFLYCSKRPLMWLALIGLELVLWLRFRNARLQAVAGAPLIYEDTAEPEVRRLGLAG